MSRSWRSREVVGLALAAAAASACGYPPLSAVIDDAGADDGGGDAPANADPRSLVAQLPGRPSRDLDLLFVVDDSLSMTDKQIRLGAAFPRLVTRLRALPGGLPNLHVGVVTTDMGTKGSNSDTPGPAVGTVGFGGCSGTGKAGALQVTGAPLTSGNFLSDIAATDGTRQVNYTGELAAAFSLMSHVDEKGCGFEQSLAAARAALDPANPTNVDFVRSTAQLGVVFLTDEDDCSAEDPKLFENATDTLGPLQSFRCTRFGVTCAVGGATPDDMNQLGDKAQCTPNPSSPFVEDIAPFRDFLLGLKLDPNQIAVAGIIGPATPVRVEPGTNTVMPVPTLAHSCSFPGNQPNQPLDFADPPVRLKAFLDLFPERSVTTDICRQDMSSNLDAIGDLLAHALGDPCLTAALRDSDAATPGLQPDCIVEDVVAGQARSVPPCNANNAPTCWRLETDATACPALDHQKLVVIRGNVVERGTNARMRCVAAPSR